MKTIHVVEQTLPMAWEKAVVHCWEQGVRIPTQYDKPGDPASRDVTVMIHITDPLAEPRIHRAFPGGLADLEKYRAEVLYQAAKERPLSLYSIGFWGSLIDWEGNRWFV